MIPAMREQIENIREELIRTAEEGEYKNLALNWIISKESEEHRGLSCYEVIRAIKLCDILLETDPPNIKEFKDFIKPLISYMQALGKFVSHAEFWEFSEIEQQTFIGNILSEEEAILLFDDFNSMSYLLGKFSKKIAENDPCGPTKLACRDLQDITGELLGENPAGAIAYLNLNENQRVKSSMSYI